jgi:O-antigen biosynthesis protein
MTDTAVRTPHMRTRTADQHRTGWQPPTEPGLPPDVWAFHSAGSTAEPQHTPTPLVSCVMPTYDRRAFVPQAVSYFLRQDYPAKELIIVDDGPELVGDLLPADARIVYHRLETRTVLGAKRNLACDLARGSIIMHWDDDDWTSPDRVSIQVAALTGGDADICGTSSLLFYDPARASAWRFTWSDRRRPWVAGTSLCFRKEFWSRFPFPEVAIGEDTRFVFNPSVRGVKDVSESGCIVAMIHRGNTAPKPVHRANWSPCPSREVEDLLGEDLAFYRRPEVLTIDPQSSKTSSTLRNGATNPWSKSSSPSLHRNQGGSRTGSC